MKPCALVALGLDGVLDLVHRVSINVGPARRVAPSGFGGVYVMYAGGLRDRLAAPQRCFILRAAANAGQSLPL